jgi:hypothetical protein
MPGLSRKAIQQIQYLFKRVASLESQLPTSSINTSSTGVHYLVKAPADGIIAYDETDDIPGMALCDVVRRFSNHTDEDKRLVAMTTKQKVFNLGPALAAGDYVLAHRDAYGDLFIPAGGGAFDECGFGDFTIVEPETGDHFLIERDGCVKRVAFTECAAPGGAEEFSAASFFPGLGV